MTKIDEKETKIEDLYFGCLNYDFNSGTMEPFNLFQSMRVLRSIAIYRTRELYIDEDFDPLRFCFGDLWGHVEYEVQIGGLFNDKTEKKSLWDLYVVPNADLLMDMVNNVSKESCEHWLKEHNW